MANEYNATVKLYYEELFDEFEYFLSNIPPGDELLRELSPPTIKAFGLEMAADVLANNSPHLIDLFAKTSIEEKYDYLLDRFASEYRSEINGEYGDLVDKAKKSLHRLNNHGLVRPSSWGEIKSGWTAIEEWEEKKKCLELCHQDDIKRRDDFRELFLSESVLSCDAYAYGRREIKTYFPVISREHTDFNDKEINASIEHDPVAIYDRLINLYASEFVAESGSKLRKAMNDLDATKRRLETHDDEKPDLLANVTSFGKAIEVWESRRNETVDYLEQCTGFVEKYAGGRSQLVENGVSSQLAIESAEKVVRSLHPDVCNAREVLMAQRWHAKRQEQEEALERQRKTDKTETGKTQDASGGMKR